MKPSSLPISQNPLSTREDLQLAAQQLLRPLLPYFSEGRARVHLGATSSGATDATAQLEGFSRILWGLVPWAAGCAADRTLEHASKTTVASQILPEGWTDAESCSKGSDVTTSAHDELWAVVLEGIRNGTNPEHPEYWGPAADYDQKLVEMAAMGFALALAPERIWQPLRSQERERLYSWLEQINHRKLHDCNWLLFQVVVNLGFRAVGMPYDRELMNHYLDRIEAFYMGNGWYTDGPHGHCDYYGPFAIHFYSLLYAVLMEKEDPARSALYKERAAAFAKQFMYWFAEDGSALPFGRSLTYRFSQCAFWGALAYAGVEVVPMGVLKGILLRNLRWWFRQPIFQPDGTLTIGYAYPNLVMAENYNAPGSPYWALKSFIPLAFSPNHPFWLAEEQPLPTLGECSVQEEPKQIVHREIGRNHVVVFNAGSRRTNEHTHTSAKYEKFAYSSAFGFSVPRAEWGLGQGAYDSMLALSEAGDNLYRVKRTAEEAVVRENMIYAKWKPWRDVEVQTWLITGSPWHVRVHCIRSDRALDAADGGFALGIEDRGRQGEGEAWWAIEEENQAAGLSVYGASGVSVLFGGGSARLIFPHANTNLLHTRTVIPTVTAKLEPGTHWIATAVYGQAGSKNSLSDWKEVPKVETTDKDIVVYVNPSPNGPIVIPKVPVISES
ncbi:DUF2264 domain-containing protein [Paenibacillus turpanensis]|uniref:DUF2264 domain-containing protein n=1 Tax=Paenibacillus turpanensis TaxID=2689078 RepID=UPI00140A171E|nr:DUF2264 domain-containing protein [Paenibacillus turpanensis]